MTVAAARKAKGALSVLRGRVSVPLRGDRAMA